MKNTAELLEYCAEMSVGKGKAPFQKTAIFALLAGVYVAFGALGSILAGASFHKTLPSLAKVLAGSVFPVGLMFVLVAGGELFTGNCLMYIGVHKKTIRVWDFARNLVIVWLFNALGTLLVTGLSAYTHHLHGESLAYLHYIAAHKAEGTFLQITARAIACNILVAGSVWMSYAGKEVISKLFTAFFPILLFTILGYDHVVANMFYLPLAYLTGANLSLGTIAHNLAAATLGNFLGGALFFSALYVLAYKKH